MSSLLKGHVGWYTVFRLLFTFRWVTPAPKYRFFALQNWPYIDLLVCILSFLISPRLWNGIVASLRILFLLTAILFFLFGASQFCIFCWFKTIYWILFKLLLFIKFRVLFSFSLSSGIITFLARVVCFPSPGWRWGK